MSNYTPSPWIPYEDEDDGYSIASQHSDGLGPSVWIVMRSGSVEDLKLAAAAPDLLEALKFAKSCIKSGEPWTPACQDVIDAAIAKARGEVVSGEEDNGA